MRKLKIGDLVYITSDPIKSKGFGVDSKYCIKNRIKLRIVEYPVSGDRYRLSPLVKSDKFNIDYALYRGEWLEPVKKPLLILEDE